MTAQLSREPIGFRCRRNDGLGEWSYVYHREPDDFERKHLVIERIFAETPAPVAVPDEQYQHLSELFHSQEKRLFKLAQRIKGPSFDKYAYSPSQAIDVLEAAIFGENEEDGSACRAAMQSFANSEQLKAEPATATNITGANNEQI